MRRKATEPESETQEETKGNPRENNVRGGKALKRGSTVNKEAAKLLRFVGLLAILKLER